MADKKNLQQAAKVYSTLCAMLDDQGWHYDKHPENYSIHCTAHGDDLPIEINIEIDAERLLVILLSPMPFSVPEANRNQLAIAVAAANYGMVDGNFDYDYARGKIYFRMTSSYRNSTISKDLLEYMLYVSGKTIDDYNDKFFLAIKNNMTVEQILDYVK